MVHFLNVDLLDYFPTAITPSRRSSRTEPNPRRRDVMEMLS